MTTIDQSVFMPSIASLNYLYRLMCTVMGDEIWCQQAIIVINCVIVFEPLYVYIHNHFAYNYIQPHLAYR